LELLLKLLKKPTAGLSQEGVCAVAPRVIFSTWEKPSKELAVRLMETGCLWNSFVMVGRVGAFLQLMRLVVPDLFAAFEAKSSGRKAAPQQKDIVELYGAIDSAKFLTRRAFNEPSSLAVLPVEHAGWTDVGEPERVMSALRDDPGYFSPRRDHEVGGP
jgi:mannose-1-phosphate guanylyltransferase